MSGGILHPESLVLGASGTVGFGVVGALLEAGSPVLALGRDGPRMQALAQHFAEEPALSLMTSGCIQDDRDAAALVATLRKRKRPLRAVFASLGSAPESGRLLDRPSRLLSDKLERDLIPHLAAARHLLPLLAESNETAHYILIGGPHAERGWAGYGHASVAASALRMLAQVLHEEAQALGVRVQMLSVDHPISTPANACNACAEWPSALAVGRCAVSLLSCHEAPKPIVRYNAARAQPPLSTLFSDYTPASAHG
ncbi:SDR family oxidoreductase [Pseudoxanthomonas wuyuanensis]|uniref:Enoyl-(Acyl carrier protein) reductase n=1 Tax=Pseudoxanthomonas wuyuanensis TaxID=1073196 RepID=A0A286D358_9GAMM|nr:SDR family oxidoreductase [Pseudoxanthomonas wuyuanensis]KAF1723012.1 NAD(P)-dependent oxidoreductase [Pseudoxanthomonas wuyuanensis]SOD53079.1 Enoyl-(Acyl carrier protein) reductase [Pseudoxanthomonas wuyuanensis]